jgi:type III secretion system HrpE/YscL family protein
MTEDKLRIVRPDRRIQAAVSGPTAERIRPAPFEQIGAANRAVSRAEQQAAQIRSDAHKEADALRREAREAGTAEARRALVAAELALRAEAVRLRERAGDRLVRLAVTLAQQVLDHELSSDPAAILRLVRRAVAQVSWAPRARVRLHPEEARRLEQAYPRLSATAAGGAELEIRADASLSPGDCLVETESGEVDGSVRARLADLEQALARSLAEVDAMQAPLLLEKESTGGRRRAGEDASAADERTTTRGER